VYEFSLGKRARGGTERIVAEAERSINDALCVARDVVREPKIVAGGGVRATFYVLRFNLSKKRLAPLKFALRRISARALTKYLQGVIIYNIFKFCHYLLLIR